MSIVNSVIDEISKLCLATPLSSDHQLLLNKLLKLNSNYVFEHVLTRGGWHRTGGVLDAKGTRISFNLGQWLQQQHYIDIADLCDQYVNCRYIATRIMGKTHYFTVQIGSSAQDFIQLEVEELYEVKDYILFNEDHYIDDIEDIIHPVDVEKISAELITSPHYRFRRITYIPEFMLSMSKHIMHRGHALGSKFVSTQRFMQDWQKSSADTSRVFCHHWVLSLQEYTDAWGESIKQAKPISTFTGNIPFIKLNNSNHGPKLANLVHSFDKIIGYPMAWYFFMLSHSEVPHQLAAAIHNDLMGAYDYLPVRDMKVLKAWSENPYGI